MASYLAKYATKSTEATGHLSARITTETINSYRTLVDLDVHPRVAMAILRHAQFAITIEVYTEVSNEATRAGLKKLGDSLE